MRIKAAQHARDRPAVDGVFGIHWIGGLRLNRSKHIDESLQLAFDGILRRLRRNRGGRKRKRQKSGDANQDGTATVRERPLQSTYILQIRSYLLYRSALRRCARSIASPISRSSSSPYGTPACSHILGNILIDVKPGIVL